MNWKKCITLFMCICMLITAVPTGVFAEEGVSALNDEQSSQEEIAEEEVYTIQLAEEDCEEHDPSELWHYYSSTVNANTGTGHVIDNKFVSIGIKGVQIEESNVSKTEITSDEGVGEKYVITLDETMEVPSNIELSFNTIGKDDTYVRNNLTKTTSTVYPIIYTDAELSDEGRRGGDFGTTLDVPFDEEKGYGMITLSVEMFAGQGKEEIYKCTLVFQTKDAVIPGEGEAEDEEPLLDATIVDSTGQWMEKRLLFEEKKAGIVSAYNVNAAKVNLEVADGVSVFVDEVAVSKEENGKNIYPLELSASDDGSEHSIVLKKGEEEIDAYTIICYTRLYSGMPDAVIDYLCMASQYTNGRAPFDGVYGTETQAVATLRGGNNDATTIDEVPPVSLGNFGGYIVYYYKDAIIDDPKNPYGIDFIVNGNSATGDSGLSEPGNVLVSEDNVNWYSLAGSFHYDDITTWNYEVQYENINGIAYANGSATRFSYPLKKYYSLFNWTEGTDTQITLTGTMLASSDKNEYGNTLPSYPAFGYADVGLRSESNLAMNPYKGITVEKYSLSTNRTDGFDLAWAVDGDGNPVSFPNGIHYIKVQTATFIDNGAIGEKSTEVNMVRRAAANDAAVGKTAEPTGIIIDGKALSLQSGKYTYDATVSGVFDVQVQGADDANVYINSTRGTTANFKEAAHGMVRIIVQEDNKEPVIYYINIEDDGKSAENTVTSILLDANGGYMGDTNAPVWYFDEDSTVKTLPAPVRDGYVFLGWFDTDGTEYTEYSSDMGEKITLYASWMSESDIPEPTGKITVYFSVLGDEAHGDKDSTVHTLAEGNLTEWIAEKTYELDGDATVLDLIELAAEKEGFTLKNSTGNYIESISYNGTTLEEFTNGARSGWMFTLNGIIGNYGVREQGLTQDDRVVLFYTDDYTKENWGDRTVAEVIAMIDALPAIEDLTLEDSADVAEAYKAFNALSEEEQNTISEIKRKKLMDAVSRIEELRKEAQEEQGEDGEQGEEEEQEEQERIENAYVSTGSYIADILKDSAVFGMEWMVMGLARADRADEMEVQKYYDSVVSMLKENGSAKISNTKSTENSRTVLALTAIGKDVTNIGGYNLLEPLTDMNYLTKQGINGPIWALIAFDSHDYEIPELSENEKADCGIQVTRGSLIDFILDEQLTDGGWDLGKEAADPDMTAMAIQALAPYYNSDDRVKAAVDKALERLSEMQLADGGFESWEAANMESCAQVIVALTALRIDPTTDSRFIKNGNSVMDALISFYVEGGGFRHIADDDVNGMATEQGYYALAAYHRMLDGKTALYDMSDMEIVSSGNDNLGDANGDGNITSTDALAILKYVAEIEQDRFIKAAADCDKDGKITANDALVVLKHVAEIEMIR